MSEKRKTKRPKKTKRSTGKKTSEEMIKEKSPEINSEIDNNEIQENKSQNEFIENSKVVFTQVYTAVLRGLSFSWNKIKEFIEFLKTKHGSQFITSILIGLIFGILPRLWNVINPSLVPSKLGLSVMLPMLLSTFLLSNNVGRFLVERPQKELEEKLIQRGISSLGLSTAFLILMLIYMKSFNALLFWSFFPLMIVVYVTSWLMYHSELISTQERALNIEVIGRFMFALALGSFYYLSFLQPYLLNAASRTAIDLIFLLAGTFLYIGLFTPFFNRLWSGFKRMFQRVRDRERGVRIDTYQMKEDYLTLLEDEGIIYASQLESMSLDEVAKIKGITKFDAAIILSTVFEMDEEELIQETIEE